MRELKKRRIVMSICAVMIVASSVIGALEIDVMDDVVLEPVVIKEASKPVVSYKRRTRKGAESVLLLVNKDTLHGSLVSISGKEGSLRWQHSNVKKPIDFEFSSVSNIKRSPGGVDDLTGNTVIELTNDDQLLGKIVSINKDILSLATSYAGTMKIKRQMVRSIGINNASGATVYMGPTDLSKWKCNNYNNGPSWSLKNGVLTPHYSYTIGKNISDMPDMVNIEFEAKWRSYPSFAFIFCSDRTDTYSGNNYSIRFSSSSVYLQRYSSSMGSSRVGNTASYNKFSSSGSSAKSAKFNVLVDKKRKRIALMIDGVLLQEWTDPNVFAGKGNGIVFYPQSSSRKPSFRNIKVSHWDGKIPQSTDGVPTKTESDIIVFENKDQVSGNIESVLDGTVTLKTAYASLTIPIERIQTITMATVSQERARRNASDMKMIFSQKGLITLNLESIKNDVVKGSSENFGDISLPLDVFNELRLNIYKEKEKVSSDW